MRLDSPGAIASELWSSGFSLMKAGWRLWPLAHIVTYAVMPPEHRLLFVDMVELAWISVLLVWSQQTAANEAEPEGAFAAAAAAAASMDDEPAAQPQFAMERSASQEMRVLLMDSMDGDATEQDGAAWQPEQFAAESAPVQQAS